MLDDPLIGHQLANFRVERLIARGGMGQVYYGWDIKLQRPVAIKVIDARYRGRPQYAQRFLREARAVATWRHPHITQVYYADDEEGLYYYVMEYVDGLDLSELVAQYKADGELMPYEDVMRIGYAVASALDYAHRKGVIHRDVKSSNIMVARDGRILLADFGLAMDLEEGSKGEAFGSPHYVSPEQARRSADAQPQSDLYSLGVILYEMLTGSLPFDDPSPTAVALQHLTLPVPSPIGRNSALGVEVESVLLKVLSKLPSDRYRTGAELMEALGDALFGEGGAQAYLPASTLLPTVALPEVVTPRPNQPTISQLSIANRVALHLGGSGTLTRDLELARYRRRRIFVLQVIGVVGALLILIALLASFLRLSATRFPNDLSPTLTLGQGNAGITTPTSPLATILPTLSPAVTVPLPTQLVTITRILTSEPVIITAIATANPSPTVLYPNGQLLRLFYDQSSFYLFNAGNSSVELYRIQFESLNSQGFPVRTFEGSRWTTFYNYVDAGNCALIGIFEETDNWLDPFSCTNYNARLTPLQSDEIIFWISQQGEAEFRVLWDNQEIARCAMTAPSCDIHLPSP